MNVVRTQNYGLIVGDEQSRSDLAISLNDVELRRLAQSNSVDCLYESVYFRFMDG